MSSERRARCSAQARSWIGQDPLILDSETTGMGQDDQVVQVAVVDIHGNVLLNTLARPTRPISPAASSRHGITNAHLMNAPTGAEVCRALSELLRGRLVCIYNADFDTRLLAQTARAWGVSLPYYRAECVMKLYAEFAGEWSEPHRNWRYHKLEDAAARCGLGPFTAHDALEDARMTARLLRHMARDAELKALYREVAKLVHPDLATDQVERERRTRVMAEANAAYERGDVETLRRILREWKPRPEVVEPPPKLPAEPRPPMEPPRRPQRWPTALVALLVAFVVFIAWPRRPPPVVKEKTEVLPPTSRPTPTATFTPTPATGGSLSRAPVPEIDAIDVPPQLDYPGQSFSIEVRAANLGASAEGGGSITISFPEDPEISIAAADVRILPDDWVDCSYLGSHAWILRPDSVCHRAVLHRTECKKQIDVVHPIAESYIRPWQSGEQHYLRVSVKPRPTADSVTVLVRVAMRAEPTGCNLVLAPPEKSTPYVDQQGFPVWRIVVPIRGKQADDIAPLKPELEEARGLFTGWTDAEWRAITLAAMGREMGLEEGEAWVAAFYREHGAYPWQVGPYDAANNMLDHLRVKGESERAAAGGHVTRAEESSVPDTQGCYLFQNYLSAQLTITFTRQPDNWNDTFKVMPSAEEVYCLDPGRYTYTIDAPPPWGAINGDLSVQAGDLYSWPVYGQQ
ncbi:MAG: exonuclease domain-containing protein [Anaerolineae bacterium]